MYICDKHNYTCTCTCIYKNLHPSFPLYLLHLHLHTSLPHLPFSTSFLLFLHLSLPPFLFFLSLPPFLFFLSLPPYLPSSSSSTSPYFSSFSSSSSSGSPYFSSSSSSTSLYLPSSSFLFFLFPFPTSFSVFTVFLYLSQISTSLCEFYIYVYFHNGIII